MKVVQFFWPSPPIDLTEGTGIFNRAANCKWLKPLALNYAKRWALLAVILWLIAWLTSGIVYFEIPLSILSLISTFIAFGFYVMHHGLNGADDEHGP